MRPVGPRLQAWSDRDSNCFSRFFFLLCRKTNTMRFIENEVYHIYNRGNNSQTIFFNDYNYQQFLRKIQTEIAPSCELLAYCLMPNHFHLIIQATEISCNEIPSYGGKPMQLLARKIGLLLSSYSQQMNRQNGTTGSLIQQKTKAKCITTPESGQTTLRRGPTVSAASYIINCMHYIHQNPLRAKLVTRLEDWKYSSFAEYAGLVTSFFCKRETLLTLTDYDLATFYKDSYMIIDGYDENL
jgi:putative transposase